MRPVRPENLVCARCVLRLAAVSGACCDPALRQVAS